MADCENSRCLVLPIVYPISQLWRFDYEHNYLKVAQLRPPVTKMVIGSINWAQGNRIMSSFYHFSHSFIHSGYLYSAPSRKLLRGALSPATVKEKCLKKLAERRHVVLR